MKDFAREAETLRAELRRHEHLYYVLDQPEVSDATPEEKVLAAVTGPEPIVPATLEPESGGIRKVSYEEFREAVARYRVDRMRDN